MSTIVRCDQCNAGRMKGANVFAPGWIKVLPESHFYHPRYFPKRTNIGGDYCCYECLLKRISLAIEERNQIEAETLAK